MALEIPEIEEVDANPVRIADGRAIVADALIALAAADAQPGASTSSQPTSEAAVETIPAD
jgi:hypothetical protein